MNRIYYTLESTMIWGAVLFALGLVIYLAYLQYLRVRRRRLRRRHRARRAISREGWASEPERPGHDSPRPLQQSTGP